MITISVQDKPIVVVDASFLVLGIRVFVSRVGCVVPLASGHPLPCVSLSLSLSLSASRLLVRFSALLLCSALSSRLLFLDCKSDTP